MSFANAIMYWHDGTAYRRITDHNRSPLTVDFERIERKQRMVDGTLRRYTVAKKRTWSCSWEMLPSKNTGPANTGTVDAGLSASEIESFYYTHDGPFNMQLRDGNGNVTTHTVMLSDFSKEVVKRGPNTDFWNLDITLEEV